jgi:hypothetical protein
LDRLNCSFFNLFIMSIGIRTSLRLAASQTVAATVTLAVLGANTTGNSFSVALTAGQRVHIRLQSLFTLAATGGFRFQWVVPAAPGNFAAAFNVIDTTNAVNVPATQVATAAFANALAVAATHQLNTEIDYTNGVNAGTISFQFACNSAANSIIMIQGAWADITLV